MARDYTKATQYESTPLQIKRRVGRNRARRLMIKQGKAHKGDGMDVDHKNHNTLDNSPKNIHMMSASANRAKH